MPELAEDRRQQLDGIVQRMVANNEPDENVRAVVSDFKQKYAPPPERTWLDEVGDFAKGAWSQLNPVTAVQGMAQAAAHPIDTAGGILSAQGALAEKAKAAFESGDYTTGLRHSLEYLIPVLGPMASQAGDKVQQGQVAEGLGEATGIGLAPFVPGGIAKVAPGAVRSVGRAASRAASVAANPAVQDAVGVVSPRMASAMRLGTRTTEKIGRIRDAVRDALKAAEAPPEQIPRQPGPVYDAQFTVVPEPGAPLLPAGAAQRLLERGPIRMGPVTEPLSVEVPPVSVPTKTGPKSAPRKSVRTKKVQEPDDAGTPLPPETEAETAARVRAHNEAFWTPRENPKASRAFAPSEKPPTKAETVERLSRGINEAIGETPAPPKLEFPSKVYADSARSAKATALAKTLHEGGISLEDARLMKQEHWRQAAKAARVKTPSLDTVQRVLFEMRKLERVKK